MPFSARLALGALFGVVALVTLPRVAGITPLTVLTGSMEPALGVGDVVLSERRSPLDVRPGDVVTFRDPSRDGELVTHRVVSMRRAGAAVRFVTKGDANDVAERWSVPADGRIGRAVLRVPKAGHVLSRAATPAGKLLLVALPAALLVLLELRGLLGGGRPRTAGAAG
jgi:signal peptidase